jgi:uncharacterized protein YbjT (DUF2867 family)
MARYLVTGATGGIGSKILSSLLELVPKSTVIATSSRASAASQFADQGIEFRQVDFNSPSQLAESFHGIDKLFFVSTPTFDVAHRVQQHRNVIEAAKDAGVGHVFYSSLAFGGCGDESTVDVQKAHLETEKMLRENGIVFTSLRMGVYADAFPVFLNWFPTDPNQTLYLPSNGSIAYASRDELGEATARLMVEGGHEKQIVSASSQPS